MRTDDTIKIDMTNGSLLRKIIIFALPLIASGILQQSFNSVDVAVVGRYCGHQALAAVGSNGMVINILINLFLGISVGANVVISNYIGQRNRDGIAKAVRTVAALALASGVLLAVAGATVARPILEMMGTPADVIEPATLYLQIYFGGMPFLMIYNFGASVLRSMGDTRRPFYSLVIAGLVNVALNLLFVICFDMGVAGVAVATVVSSAVNAGITVWFLVREREPFRLEVHRTKFYRAELRKMLSIGVPAGLQGMVFSFANIFVQSAINSYGSDAIAGSAAALNYEQYCYYVMVAFCQAAIAFTGQNYGAGKTERCKRVFKLCMALGIGSVTVLNELIVWQGDFFIGIFTDNSEVVKYGVERLRFVLMLQWMAASYEISAACMRGLGHSMTPMLLTIAGTCVLRLLWIYLYCPSHPGFGHLLVIYPITWIITGALMLTAYFIISRKAFAGITTDGATI